MAPVTALSRRRVAYYFDPDVGNFYYAQGHPMKPHRMRMTHNLLVAYGLVEKLDVFVPPRASERDMTRFHADDYISFLKLVTPDTVSENHQSLSRFNVLEDCPVFDGLWDYCQISAGGSLAGAARLNSGEASVAINWAGGLHHAKKAEASGFCYVNDCVLAILELLKAHARVLYIDIDIHHGDGVEEAFYCTDRVMTVSFHKFGGFFPGTGAIEDIGSGKGKHYAVNFPLRDGIDDDSYREIFVPVMTRVMEWYAPGAVVLQCGADSLTGDRLGCFNLSLHGHSQCVDFFRNYDVPLLLLGGGGYTIRNVARCWTYETSRVLGVHISDELPYNDNLEFYAPEFRLHIVPSNMENHNTVAELDLLTARIIEHLRGLPAAPSVPMIDVPRLSPLGVHSRDDDSDGEDPDVRRPSTKAKTVVEYDDSDDEMGDDDLLGNLPSARRRLKRLNVSTSGLSFKNTDPTKSIPPRDSYSPPRSGYKPPERFGAAFSYRTGSNLIQTHVRHKPVSILVAPDSQNRSSADRMVDTVRDVNRIDGHHTDLKPGSQTIAENGNSSLKHGISGDDLNNYSSVRVRGVEKVAKHAESAEEVTRSSVDNNKIFLERENISKPDVQQADYISSKDDEGGDAHKAGANVDNDRGSREDNGASENSNQNVGLPKSELDRSEDPAVAVSEDSSEGRTGSRFPTQKVERLSKEGSIVVGATGDDVDTTVKKLPSTAESSSDDRAENATVSLGSSNKINDEAVEPKHISEPDLIIQRDHNRNVGLEFREVAEGAITPVNTPWSVEDSSRPEKDRQCQSDDVNEMINTGFIDPARNQGVLEKAQAESMNYQSSELHEVYEDVPMETDDQIMRPIEETMSRGGPEFIDEGADHETPKTVDGAGNHLHVTSAQEDVAEDLPHEMYTKSSLMDSTSAGMEDVQYANTTVTGTHGEDGGNPATVDHPREVSDNAHGETSPLLAANPQSNSNMQHVSGPSGGGESAGVTPLESNQMAISSHTAQSDLASTHIHFPIESQAAAREQLEQSQSAEKGYENGEENVPITTEQRSMHSTTVDEQAQASDAKDCIQKSPIDEIDEHSEVIETAPDESGHVHKQDVAVGSQEDSDGALGKVSVERSEDHTSIEMDAKCGPDNVELERLVAESKEVDGESRNSAVYPPHLVVQSAFQDVSDEGRLNVDIQGSMDNEDGRRVVPSVTSDLDIKTVSGPIQGESSEGPSANNDSVAPESSAVGPLADVSLDQKDSEVIVEEKHASGLNTEYDGMESTARKSSKSDIAQESKDNESSQRSEQLAEDRGLPLSAAHDNSVVGSIADEGPSSEKDDGNDSDSKRPSLAAEKQTGEDGQSTTQQTPGDMRMVGKLTIKLPVGGSGGSATLSSAESSGLPGHKDPQAKMN